MSDIGPRRTLDLRQPPAGQTPPAQPAPQPQAQPRPAAPAPRPAAPQPVPAQPAPAAKPVKAPKPPKAPKEPRQGGSVWKVVLQFFIGLVVIAGVASAIVYLYLRYYA